MTKTTRNSRKTTVPEPNQTYYFMATLLVIYQREGQAKQRHMNILAELAQPMILKADLGTMHSAALTRLTAESEVNLGDVQDVIILNCIPLAFTTAEVFHGTSSQKTH